MRFNGLKVETIGDTVHYSAYAFKQWVEVTEEVYRTMTKYERRERYGNELKRKYGVLSLDKMLDDIGDNGDNLSFCNALIVPSAESMALEKQNQVREKIIANTARRLVDSLDSKEYEIATSVLINGDSLRSYAKTHGISRYSASELYKSMCQTLRELCRKELGDNMFDE